MKKHNITLIILLIFAFSIRLISLNQSLWLDEAIQVWSVQNFSLFRLLKDYMPGDFNPPLLHIILWFWTKVFGTSEISIRMPSVIFGTLTVYITYLFSKEIFKDKSKQCLSLLLAATAPLLIYYSQEARPYALACFLSTWSMYSFYQSFIKMRNGKIQYFISTSLMFFSHYLALFIFPTQLLILYLTSKSVKKFIPKLKTFFLPLLSLLLILPILLPQLKIGTSVEGDLPVWQSLSQFSFKALLLIPVKFLIGRIPIDVNLVSLLLVTVPLSVYLYLLFKLIKVKTSRQNPLFILFLSWLIVPIIIGIVISQKVAVFTYFRFLFVLPAFYLLFLFTLKTLKRKSFYLIFSLFLLINIFSSSTYLLNPKHHREDWKSLVSYIHQKDISDKVIILNSVNTPFIYYDQSRSETYDYTQVYDLRFQPYIWLIKYSQPIFEPNNQTEEILLNTGFEEMEEKHFRGDLIVKLMFNLNGSTAYNKN
jgi:4-amino-4-deoxy-L-arabinose transferase-like glycosyltransferase